MNYIEQIELNPGQTQKIIIAYLPETKDNGNIGNIPLQSTKEEKRDETYDYYEINGVLFFLCYRKQNFYSSTLLFNDPLKIESSSIGVASPKTRKRADSKPLEFELLTPNPPDFQVSMELM